MRKLFYEGTVTLTKRDRELIAEISQNKEIIDLLYKREVQAYNKKNSRKKGIKKKEVQKEYISLEERAEKFREDLIKNQTTAEIKFKAHLKHLNINYIFQKIFYMDKSFYIVDFYLPKYKTIIEIDGRYHNTKDQKNLDRKRSKTIKEQKGDIRRILRFTNTEVDMADSCVERIKKELLIT